jgi:magnesium transporter
MTIKEQFIEEYPQYRQEAFEKLLDISLDHDYFDEAKRLISESHIADLADFLERTTNSQKEKVLNILDEKQIAQVIVELNIGVIPTIIEMIGDEKAAKIIDTLDVDEAIYVLDALEGDQDKVIIKHLKGKMQKELQEGLAYPEGSAGRIMQKKFISLPEYWTVGQAIEYLQHREETSETFYEVFVTDPKFSPIGSIPLSTLITKPYDTVVSSIMQQEVHSVKTDLDEDEVSYLFKKYGFVTVPVVNKHNRLVGVITIDDAMEVIDKHAEENIMHMGGVKEDDVHFDLIEIIKSRFPWLLISLFAAVACSLVVNFFHDTIQQVVVLSAIMPIVAGISGNAGTQTMTVTVLSLSSKDLSALNITRVILKQIISCGCNGLILAILGGLILGALYNNTLLSLIFGLAVTINFALAGLFGSVIPIMLNKTGFDPAIASPVFVTTLTDMLSFAIFLSLSTKLLT